MITANELNTIIDPSIFRTYDIRGIVGKTLNNENIYLIGKAIGSVVRNQNGKRVIIARDGRLSSPSLIKNVCEGILSTGCDVIDIGMVPTPLLYFATHLIESQAGVMLTGSHNPPDYNGLKIVINGKTLAEEAITNLYHRIISENFYEGMGHREVTNVNERYLHQILQQIHLENPIKVVIDAGNGVTGMIAPTLFKALGCEVIELYCEVDGHFPNHEADPSRVENLQNLIEKVRLENADIGLAFDGDGDRLGVVTKKGEIIWPDRLLMLFAQMLLEESPHAKIIFDVKCSDHLTSVIESYGGQPIMWKTGHSLIKAKLAETEAKLAGEMSGHFFFNDRWYGFDDALYAGARLLEILTKTKHKGMDLFATIPNSVNTPELKILVDESEKFQVIEALSQHAHFEGVKDILRIDGLRINFRQGWGLIRPSNTTPYLILRFEAINEVVLKEIQSLFRNWIGSVRPDLVLPF